MSNFHVIYVPGFGDDYDIARRPLFRCWRILGVTTDFVPARWTSSESYADKIARLNHAIDQAKDRRIILIGESAGASLVMAVHAKRYGEIHKTVTISGKNRHGATVAPKYYQRHMAFREAMHAADEAVPSLSTEALRKFVSFYPLRDNIIPLEDAFVPGTRLVRLISVGHFFTIFLALTIYSGYILRIAKG